MIVRTLQTAESVTLFGNADARMLVKPSDNVGHVLIDVRLNAGTINLIEDDYMTLYGTQACYFIEGTGVVSVSEMDYQVSPGSLIASTSKKTITVHADTSMRIVSIFSQGRRKNLTVFREVNEITGGRRDVFWGNGRSRRLLIREDDMGFALCNTTGNANTESLIQYKNHFESCYYLSGTGEYEWGTGKHNIDTSDEQSTIFIMNEHDSHYMRIHEESICLSIFTPPIIGDETHDFENDEISSY